MNQNNNPSLDCQALDFSGASTTSARRARNDDLAHLSGSGKTADAEAFAKATQPFESIEPALWE